MSKELTEKYYNGTLPSGYYYFNNGNETYPVEHRQVEPYCLPSGITVVAPVPSYEEYKKLKEQLEEANKMLLGAKHLTVKDSKGAVMFELVSPEINEYIKKWGVK